MTVVPEPTREPGARERIAYLHGFGSGPGSTKGRALAAAFGAVGRHLDRLDLNRPSFSELTFTASLGAIDDWYSNDPDGDPSHPGGTPVTLIGSSLGGYLAARWAELNPSGMRALVQRPERFDPVAAPAATRSGAGVEGGGSPLSIGLEPGPAKRSTSEGRQRGMVHHASVTALVLLCPGLDMAQRWPALLGAAAMARWREAGTLPLPDARGNPTPVHWRFIEDALTHPPLPRPSCPTLVIHGTRDAIVPIEGSRAWVASLPNAHLIEVDDVHELYASMPRIITETLRFLAPPGPTVTTRPGVDPMGR